MGYLGGPVIGRPGDYMMGCSADVRDVGHTCFLNSSQKNIRLTLAGYSRLYGKLQRRKIQ